MADNKLEIVLTAKDATGGVFGQVSGHIKGLVGSVFSLQGAVGALLGGAGIAAAAKSMYDTGIAAERLKVSMEAVTGGVKQAAEATRFVWEESNRLGLQFEGQVKGYQQLAAAAKAAGTDQNVLKGVYIGLGEAMTALQVPAEASERVIYAVSQMMSKGKVSAEELRQQMGESLPGSFALAAKAMGVTTSQLDDMLKAGKVHTEDFLPKFARVLHETYGVAATQSSDTLQAALNRLDNQWYKLQTTIMDSGPMEAAKGIIRDVADAVRAWIGNNEELIRQKVGEWAASAASAFKVLMDSIPAIISGIELLYEAFKDFAVLLGIGGAAFLAVTNFPMLLAAVGVGAVGLSGAFGDLTEAILKYVTITGAWLQAHTSQVIGWFTDIRKQLADDWVEIKDLFGQGWLAVLKTTEIFMAKVGAVVDWWVAELSNDLAGFFGIFASGITKIAGMKDLWSIGPTAPFALMGKAAAEAAPKIDAFVASLRRVNTAEADRDRILAGIKERYKAAAMAQAEATAEMYRQNEAIIANTGGIEVNAKAAGAAAEDQKRQQEELRKLFDGMTSAVKGGQEEQTKATQAESAKREKIHKAEAASHIKAWSASFDEVYRGMDAFSAEIRDVDGGITRAMAQEAALRLDPWTGPGGYFDGVVRGWEDYADRVVREIAPELMDDIDVMTKGALDPWTGSGGYFESLDGAWTTYKDGIAEYKEPIRKTVEEMVEGAKDPWDEFFEGMSWSWDDFAKTASDAMEDIVSNGRSQLSDGFFGLIKGDMDSFSDVWEGFWDDLLRVASDVMAEITIKTAIGGLGGILGFGTGDSKSSGAGGGILGSLGGTAIGKGAGKVWGWLTGGGGTAASGGTAAAGAGVWSKIGALASNPWTWGIGAALLGGGLIARNAMTPEKRQSIDDTDFNFFDQINLNSSAANGGGDPMYAELANEAARAAQGDVVRMMDAFMAKVPEQLRDGFKDSLSRMSVHLGGGGMQIREDWLGEDTQVMYQGTLYAMFVDTFDPMIQMMERMKAQYGVDSSAFVEEGKRLQQDFFSFDPEGFWTGEYQTLFNAYYDWFNRVQEYQTGLAGQIDTAVAAQEATIKAGLTMADIVKGSDTEYRDIFQEYDKLFRDLGPLTEGYREWETAKLQKDMEEMARITGNQVMAQRWYGDRLEDLYEKIADAYQKQYGSQEAIANLVDQQLAAETAKTAEIVQAATAKPNAPNGYSYATYGLQTGGLTFEELAERKKALWGHGYGFASGGLIDRLLIPRGEDGLIGVQYGEGIVSKQGMRALEAINSGNIGSGKPPTINVYVGGEKLDARIDYRADLLMTKKANRPGMDRRRAVR